MMKFIKNINEPIDKLSLKIGDLTAIVLILLTLNVFYDTITRYIFNISSIGMQEMEWHLFSLLFLLGIPYTLTKNEHVRIDIIYTLLKKRTQNLINIFGHIVFVMPFSILIIIGSYDFVSISFEAAEQSGNPGGLPFRWLIKATIPLSFFLLLLVSISETVKNIKSLKN